MFLPGPPNWTRRIVEVLGRRAAPPPRERPAPRGQALAAGQIPAAEWAELIRDSTLPALASIGDGPPEEFKILN